MNPISPLPDEKKDPRDALQKCVLHDFQMHYTAHPEMPLLYTLDIPTGTGKSAIFIRMVKEFFTNVKTNRRLPIFVSLNYKLLGEQQARLRIQGTDSYLIRSISELNTHMDWPRKHHAIKTLHALYLQHKTPGFSDWLAKFLKQISPPQPSQHYGQSPEKVAQQIRVSIRKLLTSLSPTYSVAAWNSLLLNSPLYELLYQWDPLQLLAIKPAPVLITAHSFSMRHNIVLPQGKSWKLATLSHFSMCMNEWNQLHRMDVKKCIVMLDEADALYTPCLESMSVNLGKFDIVRCLQQFNKFAMWRYIEKIGETHWTFMAPRIHAILEWLRTAPLPPANTQDEETQNNVAKKNMLAHAQAHWEETTATRPDHAYNFPNPSMHTDWWKTFIEHEFNSRRTHSCQKLFACAELWRRVIACHGINKKQNKKDTAFSLYLRWMRLSKNCNNITMSQNDYSLYRSGMGGIFYADSATVTSSMLDNAYLVAEPLRDNQYKLVLSPLGDKTWQEQHLKFTEYLQLVRAMHNCVTNILWELNPESRDANENQDLFEYVRKYQGRFVQTTIQQAANVDADSSLNEEYVYCVTKSKTDLHPAPFSQHQPVHSQGININIMQTQESPEHDIGRWLQEGHTVIFSSATVGQPGVICGTYNLDYIARSVRKERPLAMSSLSDDGQIALDALCTLYSKQHDVIATVLQPAATAGQTGVSSWTDQWMQTLAQKDLLDVTRSNMYATETRDQSIRMLGEFIVQRCRSGLIMHQTNQDVQTFIDAIKSQAPHIIVPLEHVKKTYFLNVHALCRWLLLPEENLPETIRIAMYDRKWRSQFDNNAHALDEKNIFDTTDSPLLLFSALGSADRGINFEFSQNDVLLDIEFFSLTCDPYYGGSLRKDKEENNEILRNQEFLKLLVAQGENRTIMDSTMAYPSESYHALMPAVVDKNAQTIIQVLGRPYRYGTTGKTHIYVTQECAALLLDVYSRWNLEKKGSHVIKKVCAYIHANIAPPWVRGFLKTSHASHYQEKIEISEYIDATIHCALVSMRSGSEDGLLKYAAWSRLRNPGLYEKNFESNIGSIVKELNWLGLPSPFLHVPPKTMVYIASAEGVPYLTDIEDPNVNKRTYCAQTLLSQSGILDSLAPSWRGHKTCMHQEHSDIYIEPWFVQRFMRGILGELLVKSYIMQHIRRFNASTPECEWIPLPSLVKIGAPAHVAAQLIEMGDLFFYCKASQQLFVVDAKYWGVSQDARAARTIVADARKKQKRIEKVLYSVAAYADLRVHYALINVAGSRVWQPSENNNIFIGSATMNPERGNGPWKYNTVNPLPNVNSSAR